VALGREPAHRLVCWGGALAHDVALGAGGAALRGARLTLVAGSRDELATPDAVAGEQERLRALGVPFDFVGYDGGHHIDAAALAALAAR
jgi:predicted esterase